MSEEEKPAWTAIDVEAERFTLVISTLGRECREWAPGTARAEDESLIAACDAVIFTDVTVVCVSKSGWAFTARVDGVVVAEKSYATDLTLSSIQTEINAITLAQYLLE